MHTSAQPRPPAFSRCLTCLGASLFLSLGAGLAEAQAPAPAQPAASPLAQSPTATRPKNFYLMIFGYEMDKARADAILQTQDMSKDVSLMVEKLEGLTRSKGATHVSNASIPLRSGVRCAMNTEAVAIETEGALSPAADVFNLKLTRKATASGTSAAVSASLDIQGTPFFIGTVPDASPGKDQLIFMRCVVQFLE